MRTATAPVLPTADAAVTLRPLSAGAELTGGFWADRLAANDTAIPLGYDRLTGAGNIDDLRVAAGRGRR